MSQQVRYSAFIDEPYDLLVSDASRFWNASGISLSASAEGIRLEIGSLQTLLAGGVAPAPWRPVCRSTRICLSSTTGGSTASRMTPAWRPSRPTRRPTFRSRTASVVVRSERRNQVEMT